MQRLVFIFIAFFSLVSSVNAQIWLGPNLGPAWGRTADVQLICYPKNEDWIAATFSGGYTFGGPMYFPRKKTECVSDFRNQGWHLRVGARNGLTTNHDESHFYWGLEAVYSRQNESAVFGSCSGAPGARSQAINVLSGSINFGITINPLHKKTIDQVFLVDIGLRTSYPFWSGSPLLGERDYISGVGFTWLPIRSIAFEPMVILRWELFHNRYGFWKGKEKPRYNNNTRRNWKKQKYR